MPVFLLFDISGGELLLILLVVLLLFGAKGIPDIARTMGKAMRQMRDASDSVQREINRSAHEMKRGFDQQVRPLREAANTIAEEPPAPSPPPPLARPDVPTPPPTPSEPA
jgi:sec-independent protein translocase protein TatA